ncbi:tyrosine-sulfated glycopeptide receptor 1-like [Malus sylvestris]|uniref:tyrosine-sulfated glycopeptide receptor 1-like n=1 Tax=Malus sylvestris TaxID=3752 RepID=UPI0021ABBDF2|nr:tyrosine-sulfated glycopeptide receptor 1-like [Malus sylvestris]
MAHGFLHLFLFSCIISTTNIHACNQTEHTLLLALAHTLSSLPLNWSSSVDCCHWNGITCNQEGWVTHLLLPSKGLKGGKIPWSMTGLNFLTDFIVSYNNLKGRIPMGTQLQSFNASSFEGNPKLCGTPLPNECKEIDVDNENNVNQDVDNEHNELPWFYIFVVVGFIVGFWGIFGYLVLKKT